MGWSGAYGFLDGYIFELSIPNDIYETVKVDEKYCMLIQPEINIASQIGCKRYINNYAFSDFYLDL